MPRYDDSSLRLFHRVSLINTAARWRGLWHRSVPFPVTHLACNNLAEMPAAGIIDPAAYYKGYRTKDGKGVGVQRGINARVRHVPGVYPALYVGKYRVIPRSNTLIPTGFTKNSSAPTSSAVVLSVWLSWPVTMNKTLSVHLFCFSSCRIC